ncbi:hypothetical protein BJ875DRAFT_535135 [Amylocarpus encephaloides]|uniref:Uncharacterized protein n=1 Tax=Amylocarpus encephaloides TaxID=45428 RepID=A0A9P7YHZ6_9HELO|nr:hypothetical protein BJ875DRAFT_535135 [Amylocarpus encephaloides]
MGLAAHPNPNAPMTSHFSLSRERLHSSLEERGELALRSVMQLDASELGAGTLDIVVVNAGIVTHCPAEEYAPEHFKEIMDVNLNKAGGKRGNVVFMASVSAILVNVPQKQAAYNASKAGVVQLVRCSSVEWVDFCRVNCVSPGFIATDMLDMHPKEWREKCVGMIPAARLCEPAELKGAYVFCASDASSCMTGANLVIDGGYTLP